MTGDRRAAQVALAEATRAALRSGTLVKPKRCARCQELGRVVACHLRVDIIRPEWLCRGCYNAVCPRVDLSGVETRRGPLRPPERVQVEALQPPATSAGVSLLERAVDTGQRRSKTKESYLASVRAFVSFAGPDQARWTTSAVEAWRDHLARSISPRSVNVRLSGLKYAARRLEALGWGRNFALAAEKLSAPVEKRRAALTVEVARRLLATCESGPRGMRDRALLLVGFRLGVRREGIVNLDLADVGPGRQVTVVLKGGARHVIRGADDEVLGALRTWARWLASQGVTSGALFRAVRQRRDGGTWYVSEKRLRTASVNYILNERAEQAGLSGVGVHPHLMRHSFISWAIADGVPDRRVMAVTGQRDPKTLSGYHTDLRAEDEPIGNSLPSLLKAG